MIQHDLKREPCCIRFEFNKPMRDWQTLVLFSDWWNTFHRELIDSDHSMNIEQTKTTKNASHISTKKLGQFIGWRNEKKLIKSGGWNVISWYPVLYITGMDKTGDQQDGTYTCIMCARHCPDLRVYVTWMDKKKRKEKEKKNHD